MLIKPNKQRQNELVNEGVPNAEMLVIDGEGNKLGILSKKGALDVAKQYELDLVVVSPDSSPMVAKLLDYSKYRYDQQKKLKEMKKNQHIVKLKETKLSPTIDKHDFDTKLKQTIKFLEKGDKVKVSIRFHGRMITHQQVGLNVILRFIEALENKVVVESQPKMEGRIMMAIVAPNPSNVKKEG